MDGRRRLQRRADALFLALDLERAGHHLAHFADLRHFSASGVVTPFRRNRRELFEMHGNGLRVARKPCLSAGRQHGCKPGHQAIEKGADDLQGRAAAQRRRRVTIERILADVEIESREFDIRENR